VVKAHRLARNPAADATPPSAKEAKAPEMHPWNAAQLAAFLAWSEKHSTHHALWHVLAMTGMRRWEIGQQPYLSHRTVRNHLYRIFPKLGVTSRTELAATVGATPGAV
jgi:DNA-binding NarL/FixJ family response regulator